MITLSVPVPLQLERFVNRMVRSGAASTKAEVVRQALSRYAEEKLVESVLLAEQELKEGKEVRGNLREVLKRMK